MASHLQPILLYDVHQYAKKNANTKVDVYANKWHIKVHQKKFIGFTK